MFVPEVGLGWLLPLHDPRQSGAAGEYTGGRRKSKEPVFFISGNMEWWWHVQLFRPDGLNRGTTD